MSEMRISAVGMMWFRNATEYAEYMKLFEDAHVLPVTFSKWQKLATKMYESQLRNGMVVVKAQARPDEFRAWCATHGQGLDANGRMKFASFKAAEKLRQAHSAHEDQ